MSNEMNTNPNYYELEALVQFFEFCAGKDSALRGFPNIASRLIREVGAEGWTQKNLVLYKSLKELSEQLHNEHFDDWFVQEEDY